MLPRDVDSRNDPGGAGPVDMRFIIPIIKAYISASAMYQNVKGHSGLYTIMLSCSYLKTCTRDIHMKLFLFCIRWSDSTAICCIAKRELDIKECLPDVGISSCEDLIRDQTLRVCIWIVGASCLLFNAVVVKWRLKEHKVWHTDTQAWLV